VANRYNNPLAYETISVPPSFDSPYTRSTNDMGTWRKECGIEPEGTGEMMYG